MDPVVALTIERLLNRHDYGLLAAASRSFSLRNARVAFALA